MTQLSKDKGFFVNTSAMAAKSIDVGVAGSRASSVLLADAISDTRRLEAKKEAAKTAEEADKALLLSLSDGTAFEPVDFAEGKKGTNEQKKENSEPVLNEEAIILDVVAQSENEEQAPSSNDDLPVLIVEDSEEPSNENGEETIPVVQHEDAETPKKSNDKAAKSTQESFVKRYKWWIGLVALVVLYLLFRR